jgi:hypothetical protein
MLGGETGTIAPQLYDLDEAFAAVEMIAKGRNMDSPVSSVTQSFHSRPVPSGTDMNV